MIHKNVKLTKSIFDNREHNPWADPWVSDITHNSSFWDLYESALRDGKEQIAAYAELLDSLLEGQFYTMSDTMFKANLREVYASIYKLTDGKNFYGCDEKIADPETGKPK